MVRSSKAKKQGAGLAQKSNGTSCKFVVSVDIGTTFSGAAFALLADLDSTGQRRENAVQLIHNWPGQAESGAMSYCKTQTSVWYIPGREPGTFELKGWGWKGYVGYKECLQAAGSTVNEMEWPPNCDLITAPRVSAGSLDRLHSMCGYFVEKFKVGLAGKPLNLPDGLSVERVISDYLRELSKHVLNEIRMQYSRDAGSHREIQYIVTVPAMWTTRMRQAMKDCVEMAGMVQGDKCKDNAAASLLDLKMVSEPEAAALQVYKSLQITKFKNSEKFLLVDVGGGTTDIVVHEKVGSTTRRNFNVKEVSASIGELVGGIHVDEQFYDCTRETIGCFSSFEKKNPRYVLEMNRAWNDLKCTFSGSKQNLQIPVQGKLAKLWKRFDRANSRDLRKDYDFLHLTPVHAKGIFDPVVERIKEMIRRQYIPGLSAIYVVGGFSGCPYLRDRIEQAFKDKTEVIFVRNPGSAVMQGATLCGPTKEWSCTVSTRIASRTIGFDTTVLFKDKRHRKDYMVVDENEKTERCDKIFHVLIRRGDDVPNNCVYTQKLSPVYRKGKEDGDDIEINLYETQARNPRYVTGKGVRKLATCSISVPKEKSLGRVPELELTLKIGQFIRASVEGKNFFGKKRFSRPVWMKWAPLEATLADSRRTTAIVVKCDALGE